MHRTTWLDASWEETISTFFFPRFYGDASSKNQTRPPPDFWYREQCSCRYLSVQYEQRRLGISIGFWKPDHHPACGTHVKTVYIGVPYTLESNYCTNPINSSHLVTCDRGDEILVSSHRWGRCDHPKNLSKC